MNQQINLNFETENLVVDWISFNIKGLTDSKSVTKIAIYLFESFGFHSILKNSSKRKSKALFGKPENEF